MLGGPSAYAGSQAAMPPPAPRAPGTRGSGPRGGGGGVFSQAGGVGRRFWRTSGGSVSSIAKGETYAMQKRMAAKRARDKATRAKRAVIYRKYRDGELPDIMIKLGDVLRPLQHLSMLDGGIAREVFVQIFKEVYAGFGGSARDPSASRPADKARTQPELDDEILREASVAEGKRAVSVLLQRMLSAARYAVAGGGYGVIVVVGGPAVVPALLCFFRLSSYFLKFFFFLCFFTCILVPATPVRLLEAANPPCP
ncbi:unnamed protein product [Ectocarpus sp. 13 AM-2016]